MPTRAPGFAMFSVVFWNIGQKGVRDGIVRLIASLQREEDADLVALAECSGGVLGSVLRSLNPAHRPPRFVVLPTRSRVQVVFRGRPDHIRELDRHEYYSVLAVRDQGTELLVVVVHMVSLVKKDPAHIDKELMALGEAVRAVEAGVRHDRTVL